MLDPKKRSPLPWRPIEEKPWYVRHGARSDPQRQNPMTWRLYADPSASSSTGHAVVPSVSQPLLTCKYLKTLRTNDTDRATASPFCNTAKSSTDIFIYDGGTEGSDAENDSRGGPKYGQGASVPKRQKKDNHRICNIRLNGKDNLVCACCGVKVTDASPIPGSETYGTHYPWGNYAWDATGTFRFPRYNYCAPCRKTYDGARFRQRFNNMSITKYIEAIGVKGSYHEQAHRAFMQELAKTIENMREKGAQVGSGGVRMGRSELADQRAHVTIEGPKMQLSPR